MVVGNSVEQKRALVLSPFKYFFKGFDDGAPVAQLLENTRGYGGNVTYLENATKTAATVGIEQFAGWENYDVIHVTGHGAQVCDVNRCVATILTGDIYSNADDLLQLTELGLNTAHVRGTEDKFLALSPDYFKKQYPARPRQQADLLQRLPDLLRRRAPRSAMRCSDRTAYFSAGPMRSRVSRQKTQRWPCIRTSPPTA